MAAPISIISFYKFRQIPEPSLSELKSYLNERGNELSMKGLILVGSEGINGTVAGPSQSALDFENLLQKSPFVGELEFKRSEAASIPFAFYKVKIRPEIVTLGKPGLAPLTPENEPNYLEPDEWDEYLNRESNDVVVLDTRNTYESKLGKFKNAIAPDIEEFRDFGSYLERSNLPKDKTYLIYCTGGIRCEKAALEMNQKGYQHVLQLKGGILKYIEKHPERAFEGECFVFDHRVAVDQKLKPTERYKNCPHCGQPGETKLNCTRCETPTCICETCALQAQLHSCSKNCAYHLKLKPGKKGRRQIVTRAHSAKRKEL